MGKSLRYIYMLVFGALALIVGLWAFNNVPNWNKGDQERYYHQVEVLQDKGLFGGFDFLATEYVEKATDVSDSATQGHHPLRISRILLHRIFHVINPNINSGAYISIFSFVLILILSFWFVSKYWSHERAIMVCLLLLVAPLFLAYSGKALTETLFCFTILASLFSILHYLENPSSTNMIWVVLALFLAISTKEQSLLLYPFFALILLKGKLLFEKEANWGHMAIMLVAPIVLYGVLCAVIFGVSDTMEMVGLQFNRHIVNERTSGHLALKDGPWYRYIVDFMILSPTVSLLFLASLGYYFYNFKKEFWKEYVLIGLFFYTLIAFSLIIKNVRYVLFLEFVYRFFAASMLLLLAKQFMPKNWKMVAGVGIFLLVASSFLQANYLFRTAKTGNVLSYHLLKAEKFFDPAALETYRNERVDDFRVERLEAMTYQMDQTLAKQDGSYKIQATKLGTSEAYNMLAMEYLQEKDYQKSVEYAEKSLQYREKSLIAYACLCEGYLHLKKFEKSIQNCEKSLEIMPDYPNIKDFLGRAKQRKTELLEKKK